MTPIPEQNRASFSRFPRIAGIKVTEVSRPFGDLTPKLAGERQQPLNSTRRRNRIHFPLSTVHGATARGWRRSRAWVQTPEDLNAKGIFSSSGPLLSIRSLAQLSKRNVGINDQVVTFGMEKHCHLVLLNSKREEIVASRLELNLPIISALPEHIWLINCLRRLVLARYVEINKTSRRGLLVRPIFASSRRRNQHSRHRLLPI